MNQRMRERGSQERFEGSHPLFFSAPHTSVQINPGSVNTIEPNIEALNAKKGDIAFMVDPLFRKTSAAFDQGGVKGLLLNHLEVQEGCALVFDSADAVDLSNQATIVPDTDCCIAELYGKLWWAGRKGEASIQNTI